LSYDYSKLIGRIKEKCGTQSAFSKQMGLSERTISLKLNNKIPFSQNEIHHAVSILGLKDSDIQRYFFALMVQSD
jgi:hypothetical protein